MSKSVEVLRTHPLGRGEATSFSILYNGICVAIDWPDPKTRYSSAPPPHILLLTHEHPDHLNAPVIDIPTYMSPAMWGLIQGFGQEKDRTEFTEGVEFLVPGGDPLEIPAFGQVIPFWVNHSTISNIGYFLVLENGTTIVHTSDSRMGRRTQQSLEYFKNCLNGERIDLLIADATQYRKEDFSKKTPKRQEESVPFRTHEAQASAVKSALELADSMNLPVTAYVKYGDYGQIFFWLQQKDPLQEKYLLQGRRILFTPGMAATFCRQEIQLDKVLERFGIQLEVFQNPGDTPSPGDLIFYDNPWEGPLNNGRSGRTGFNHITINASPNTPYTEVYSNVLTYQAGMSGHDHESYKRFHDVTRPRHQAESHSGKYGKIGKTVLPHIGSKIVL